MPWVDLHPPGMLASEVYAVHAGQQGGHVELSVTQHRACLWSGTAESWGDLHPGAATTSEITAVHRGKQVGSARLSGSTHAGVWFGSSSAWIDLHSALPAEYTSSWARGIWIQGLTIYLVGEAWNSRDRAVLWTIPCPADHNRDGFLSGEDFDLFVADFEAGAPSADINYDGFLTGDDFDLFLQAFNSGC